MADALHAALVAAIDVTERCAASDEHELRTTQVPLLCCHHGDGRAALRRVAADRRVLARHAPHTELDWFEDSDPACLWEWGAGDSESTWPCPDVLDLAARYGVEVPS